MDSKQGSMDRIDVDPLTMCTHHFTIFNIDCTKLTLKESNQGDADRVTPDDLYAGGEKMIDWAILTQNLWGSFSKLYHRGH